MHIIKRTKVIETIVTVVYKQGHLVLGFVMQVYSIFDGFFTRSPTNSLHSNLNLVMNNISINKRQVYIDVTC